MYLSKGQHYTYGSMQYDAILAMSKTDIPDNATVWCNDNYRVWWFSSKWNVWTTNDCVILNYVQDAKATGDVVRQDTTDMTVERETIAGTSGKPLGVVLDFDDENDVASIAFTGRYKALAGITIVAGNGANVDSTDGRMNDGVTSDGSGTKGNFGVCAESGSDRDLLWVEICVKREYF